MAPSAPEPKMGSKTHPWSKQNRQEKIAREPFLFKIKIWAVLRTDLSKIAHE